MNDLLIETILRLVEAVPEGRVTTYGRLAAPIGTSPRVVARILAEWGSGVPWWRVVNAKGELPPRLVERAVAHWEAEETPLAGVRGLGNVRGGGSARGVASDRAAVVSRGVVPRVDVDAACWVEADMLATLEEIESSLAAES